MKMLIRFAIALMLVVPVAAQTGEQQPDVKAKPAEKPPAGAPTGNKSGPAAANKPATPGANEMMAKPAPEMEKLIRMLSGQWSVQEKHEPSEFMPQGGTGKGREVMRPGPGNLSILSDYNSMGAMGRFTGHGITMWIPEERIYKMYWLDNTRAGAPSVLTGKWVGNNLVFTGTDEMMGKKMNIRETFSDITPTSFTFTTEVGPVIPANAPLKKVLTINYTKYDARNLRNELFAPPGKQ